MARDDVHPSNSSTSGASGGARGSGTPSGVPVCYRHPERETYIRCSRCERSICPDCMLDAPVGFHCPDCVRHDHHGSRPVRQVVGTARPNQGVLRGGLVTKVIIGINIAVFCMQYVGGDAFNNRFELLSKGYDSSFDTAVGGVASGQWYRLLTSMFLHVSITHIAVNMISLYVIGVPLENLVGRMRFAAVYLVSGLAGAATSYFFMPSRTASMGASGAIFGVVGALLVIGIVRRYNMSLLIVMVVVNLALGFTFVGIDWRDHLGGLAAGLLIGACYVYAPRAWRSSQRLADATVVLPVGIAVVLLGASAAMVAVHSSQLNHDDMLVTSAAVTQAAHHDTAMASPAQVAAKVAAGSTGAGSIGGR